MGTQVLRFGTPVPPSDAVTIASRYVMDIKLAANQTIQGQLRQAIDNDSDFLWRGVSASTGILGTNEPGAFAVRFNDGAGYYYSSDYLNYQFFTAITGLPCPYVMMPQAVFKAGSYIGVDIQNLSAIEPTVVQLVFWGARRYLDMRQAVQKALREN